MVNRQSASLDSVFAALADPTRRAFLARLAQEASSPGSLAEPVDMSLPAVSKHLRVLERAGLIVRRRQGRRHELRLVPTPLEEAAAWIAYHRAFWERQLDSLARFLDQTPAQEEKSWPPPAKARVSRSKSAARSRIRARRSSTRGRPRKR